MRPVCLRCPSYACNSLCACAHVRTHPCMHARMIQRYADLSLEELRGEHYLRCLQPSDKSATVDAPPTGSSTDAGGVDYVRSASLQTPYLGNAMTPSLAATKPNPRNDSNALGGAMEATGYLDVAVVAVKNVPALPSLPHAFEVACTIGVDGMVSNTDKQKHRGTHVRALSPSSSPSLTPSPPLSLPRALLSLSSLSSLSLSLSLFSLFSLSLCLSFSHTHKHTGLDHRRRALGARDVLRSGVPLHGCINRVDGYSFSPCAGLYWRGRRAPWHVFGGC